MMLGFISERRRTPGRSRFVGARTVASLGAGAVVLAGLTAGVSGPAAAVTGAPPRVSPAVCPGYSGLHTTNPYASVKKGLFISGGRAAVKVTSVPSPITTAWGSPVPVTVNWAANPYADSSWQSWYFSLKWLGALVYTGGGRQIPDGNGGLRVPTTDERWDALDLALGVTKSYLETFPNVATAPTKVQYGSFAHRTQFLACLAEALGPENTPAWLTTAARKHAAYLSVASHYSGAWNQGLDQDLGVLAVGCIIGPSTHRDFAVRRITRSLGQAIGADGVPHEQAPGYDSYQYTLWGRALSTYAACGLPPDGAIPTRIAGIPAYLSQATRPDGTVVQLGDTVSAAPQAIPGTEYVTSRGASGSAPADRVAIFRNAGFVFGRSAWSPFSTASFYSLRFGPATAQHGHYDHTSMTWMVGGQDRLVDSGHVGYSNTDLRTKLRAPEAHNVMTATQYRGFRIAGSAPISGKPSTLVSSSLGASADSFMIDAHTYGYITTAGPAYTTQRRAVLIARDPDLLVVFDSTWGAPKSVTWNQHWHLPVGWTATSLSRSRVQAAAGSARTTLIRIPLSAGSAPVVLAASNQAPRLGVLRKNIDVQFPSVGRSAKAITVVAPVASSDLAVSLSGRTLTIVSAGTTVRVAFSVDGTLTRLS